MVRASRRRFQLISILLIRVTIFPQPLARGRFFQTQVFPHLALELLFDPTFLKSRKQRVHSFGFKQAAGHRAIELDSQAREGEEALIGMLRFCAAITFSK
jgi:hypothetical protein